MHAPYTNHVPKILVHVLHDVFLATFSSEKRCTRLTEFHQMRQLLPGSFQVRGTDGTWQFIGRVKSERETPVSRGDAYRLLQKFQAAMVVMDNQGGSPDGRAEAFRSPMQNDMHALQVIHREQRLRWYALSTSCSLSSKKCKRAVSWTFLAGRVTKSAQPFPANPSPSNNSTRSAEIYLPALQWWRQCKSWIQEGMVVRVGRAQMAREAADHGQGRGTSIQIRCRSTLCWAGEQQG